MSKIKKRIFLWVVLIAAVVWGGYALRQVAYIPPILMYHSISAEAPGDTLHVSEATFDKQMQFLRDHHYRVLSLESLAALIGNKKKIPPKAVAITFDDGRKDNYSRAFPILTRHRLPATIFIIVNEVGRIDRMNWDELKELVASGIVSIGSHTLDHPYLVEAGSEDELRTQIIESKKSLEARFNRPVTTFSYPIGGFNAGVRKIVMAAGYICAVATTPGKRYPNDDIFALKRIKITEKSGDGLIFWIQTSGYYTFFKDFFSRKESKGYGD